MQPELTTDPVGDVDVVVKLLTAMAGGTRAKEEKTDVLFRKAADIIRKQSLYLKLYPSDQLPEASNRDLYQITTSYMHGSDTAKRMEEHVGPSTRMAVRAMGSKDVAISFWIRPLPLAAALQMVKLFATNLDLISIEVQRYKPDVG